MNKADKIIKRIEEDDILKGVLFWVFIGIVISFLLIHLIIFLVK